jgi:hypothetical protein
LTGAAAQRTSTGMFRRTLCALPLLAAAGCAQVQPAARPPPPAPKPVRADRAAPVTLPQRVRQEAWMTRFWEELTPSQRRRVLVKLRRGDPPAALNDAEAAVIWDPLGLPDRNALLFGAGLPRTALTRPESNSLQASDSSPKP